VKKGILNLGALTCIQGANALAPLVIFPYALHALGSQAYAELALSEAIALLSLAIVIFSFDVIGVTSVVHLKAEDNHEGISQLFSSILYIRLFLLFSAAIVAIPFYHFALGGSSLTIALWTLVPLAYIFQSTWLFQGLESNLPPAVFAMASRLACVGLIFAFVGRPSDKNLVPAIMGATYMLGGLASVGYAAYRYGLRLRRVALKKLLHLAHDGKEIFFGNISVSLSRDFNVLILGLVGVPAHSLAAYSVAEKFTKSLQAVARPLNQLFFPKAVRAIRNEHEPSRPIAKKIFRQTVPQLAAVAVMLLVLVIGYLVAAKYTTRLAAFPNIEEIISFLSVMAPGVFFGVVSFMFGGVGLNYLNCRAYYFRVILLVGILSASTCFLLAHWTGASAAVYCYLGSEILTALLIVQRFVVNFRFLAILGGPRKR
jgi:PST family polysaccharide transporter